MAVDDRGCGAGFVARLFTSGDVERLMNAAELDAGIHPAAPLGALLTSWPSTVT